MWHEDQQAGLGKQFLDELDDAKMKVNATALHLLHI
ncbi:hypothetical protein COMA2_20099 [Candidatus Nitrospira nitrificans]|uniref:Uncharacterized protein n=1 Tax=Candidatus Nitrospira nitrificans TaxID=1742973 RepID=A0A0S4LGJ7_9BACT|nr:hypothetical protein COMA2_20099 [Candidatus Nitrospira nitrificans]